MSDEQQNLEQNGGNGGTNPAQGGEQQGGTQGGANQQPVTVDWSKITANDIPLDVLKQHPEYKKVLDESINRRKKIRELTEDEQPQQQKPNTQQTDTANNDMLRQLSDQVAALQKTQLDTFRLQAAQVAGLDIAKHLPYITGNTLEEMTVSAKQVAADFGIQPGQGNRPAGGSGGSFTNPSSDNKDSSMLNRIKAKTMGQQSENPFAPGLHRQMGGGPVIGNS